MGNPKLDNNSKLIDNNFINFRLQQEHNHFSGVSRLAKRWLSCQMLLDHYNEEAIDLLCAYLFVHPAPFEAPK